jgi:GNAT superfamily N-acetyltransferase
MNLPRFSLHFFPCGRQGITILFELNLLRTYQPPRFSLHLIPCGRQGITTFRTESATLTQLTPISFYFSHHITPNLLRQADADDDGEVDVDELLSGSVDDELQRNNNNDADDDDDDDEAEVEDDAPVFLTTAARVRSKSPSLRRRRRIHYTDNANNQRTEVEEPLLAGEGLDGVAGTIASGGGGAASAAVAAAASVKSSIKHAQVERIFPELQGAALVRELHVYGQLVATADKTTKKAQHVGYGTQLMNKVEELSRKHGATSTAVISGVGVRNFYRKLGYELSGEGEMMIKPLPNKWDMVLSVSVIAVIVAVLLVLLWGLATGM